jgi:hypothetical protein
LALVLQPISLLEHCGGVALSSRLLLGATGCASVFENGSIVLSSNSFNVCPCDANTSAGIASGTQAQAGFQAECLSRRLLPLFRSKRRASFHSYAKSMSLPFRFKAMHIIRPACSLEADKKMRNQWAYTHRSPGCLEDSFGIGPATRKPSGALRPVGARLDHSQFWLRFARLARSGFLSTYRDTFR